VDKTPVIIVFVRMMPTAHMLPMSLDIGLVVSAVRVVS